ncbi:hypothetical protein [Corynebacterium aurimucosum]|uniref:hypothetical protein n=1 Tax=Corynebacterium aurimucosum TaxID=169292 RepID=UPI0001BCDAE8|nr:hypothetical protein [Corynebacterium aurimucosum]QQU92510.1 hypothetical protein I6I67_09735 [Corynebacterium aurimucosum]
MKRITRRQQLLVLLLLLAIVCGVFGVWLDTLVPMYLELVLVLLGLFIVLRSGERGQYKSFRKTEKLQKQLTVRLDNLDARLGGIGAELSKSENVPTVEPNGNVKVDEVFPLFEDLIDKMNEQAQGDSQITLSQQVSVRKVINWLRPTLLLTTDAWLRPLEEETKVNTAHWVRPDPSFKLPDEVKLAVVDSESFLAGRGSLMVSNHLGTCALVIIESPNTEKIESIAGFAEIAPVGMMHGVRLFYPSSALEPAKYSKLVKYI